MGLNNIEYNELLSKYDAFPKNILGAAVAETKRAWPKTASVQRSDPGC